jgi:cytochrome c553
MRKITFALVFCSYLVAHASADPMAGKEKSATCIACHGQAGISENPEWPSLAGQHADYLVKQLQYFKQGEKRSNALMEPVIAELTQQDMVDLAAFYAKQPLPELSTAGKYLKRGEQLYRGGDFDKHITACIACHGPRGLGNAQAGFPVLSGQQPTYTIQQLQAFKNGTRRGDFNEIMRDISARMSKEDMEAVAHYMAGLH